MHAGSLVTFLTLFSSVVGRVQYLGVAIPGIDFGCSIDGSCPLDTVESPLTSLGGGDGEGQMKHFTENDGLNIFRLPATWQYLLNDASSTSSPGSALDATNFANYDQLVQTCLQTGAWCMIDIHNFARYNGGIIGQGGPTNEAFANLWTQIATKYANESKVAFGLMNEPHDLDINLWAETCQYVVTAIRKAGATSQMIFLPGTNFESAATLVSGGSFAALANVTNPDGSTDNLLLDIHKYLDVDNSGTHVECTTDNVADFQTVADWLRNNSRTAIISESGASMDPTCLDLFCVQNNFISNNSDVFVGFVSWAAGSFSTSYILSLTPSGTSGNYTDNELMKQCILTPFIGTGGPLQPTTTTTSSPSATNTDSIFTEETASAAVSSSASSSPTGTSADTSKSSDTTKSAGARGIESFTGGLMLAVIASCYTSLCLL